MTVTQASNTTLRRAALTALALSLLPLLLSGCPEQPAAPAATASAPSAKAGHRDKGPKSKPGGSASPSSPAGGMPGGLYALIRFDEQPREPTWSKDFVDGLVIRIYWRSFYASGGRESSLDWSRLDRLFATAATRTKKLRLMVVPGFYSPDWVLNQVPTADFMVPQGPDKGSMGKLPIPWNDKYLELWTRFVSQFGKRYGSRPQLSYVSLTGPGSHNGEVGLPREDSDMKRWLELVGKECSTCKKKKDQEKWLAERLVGAYEKSAGAFDKAFGARQRYYTLALIQSSLPMKNRDLLHWYWGELAGLGKGRPYFGLQTNGMDGRDLCPSRDGKIPGHWKVVQKHSRNMLTGFQTEYTGNLFDCDVDGDGNIGPKDKRAILKQTVDNTIKHGGRFLEVYESIVLDDKLQDVLREASTRLKK